MNKTTFTSPLVQVAHAEQVNPYQSLMTFVFTDFEPNQNKMGVPKEEAANIIESGKNMPVKIHYNRGAERGHDFSFPIGPIVNLYEQDDKIYAQAMLWRREFDEIDEYIRKTAEEEGSGGIQFSWELGYTNNKVDENGVNWLYGIIVAAATIVDRPAYAGRTPLLAIAEMNLMEELEKQVASLTDKLYSIISELYSALEEARPAPDETDIDTIVTQASDLIKKLRGMRAEQIAEQIAELTNELESVRNERDELVTFKQSLEAEAERQNKLSSIRDRIKEAGIELSDEEFDQRSETYLTMAESAFSLYLSDIKGRIAPDTNTNEPADEVVENIEDPNTGGDASAEMDGGSVPDPITLGRVKNTYSKKDIVNAFRQYRLNKIAN